MNGKDSEKNKNDYNLKLSLKLEKSKYSPLEEIQGFLLLEIKQNQNNLLKEILQSDEFQMIFQEKVSYNYSEKKSKIYILDKKSAKFNDYEILEDNNSAKIPIKYKLPDEQTKNFYPTFRYFSKSLKCIITHSFQIEIPSKSTKASVNIFIKKLPMDKNENKKEELDKVVFRDETIKKYNLFNKGRLAYLIKTKKSINYKEKLPVEIHIDERELDKIKIESVTLGIKKSIYLYNDIQICDNNLETYFSKKKLYLNQKERNTTIKENLELPKTEFIPLSQSDIQRLNYKDEKFNFTPPVNNILFKCEYILQVIINFSSKLMKSKEIDIPIDYYDMKCNNNKVNEIEYNDVNNINDYDDGNDNEFNEIFGDNDKNHNNINGFTQITKKDFINALDGKEQ